MMNARRLTLAALAMLALLTGPGLAAAAEPDRTCLDPVDSLQTVQVGKARRLTELKGGVEGDILRADLCRNGPGYVYFVTALQPDGKIRRLVLDATPLPPARTDNTLNNRVLLPQ